MGCYLIKKKNKAKRIVKFNYEEIGYQFKPNIKNPNLIKITSLTIPNTDISSPILENKLDKSFRKLASIILSVLNDEDTTTGDILIALDEVSKQKSIILNKYKDYLKKQTGEKYLKRLKVLEAELKQKLVYVQNKEEVLEEGYSR